MPSKQALNGMTVDQLKQSEASILENIGALRASISRIETLEETQMLLKDLLEDCRVALEAHGYKPLVNRIDKAIRKAVPVAA